MGRRKEGRRSAAGVNLPGLPGDNQALGVELSQSRGKRARVFLHEPLAPALAEDGRLGTLSAPRPAGRTDCARG